MKYNFNPEKTQLILKNKRVEILYLNFPFLTDKKKFCYSKKINSFISKKRINPPNDSNNIILPQYLYLQRFFPS